MRIQSSVSPRVGRRARFARTAAAALSEELCGSDCDRSRSGIGRRKGVSMSRWWIGDSSEPSLLTLRRRRLLSDSGYGEPQLAVTNWVTSGGGVLKNCRALSGSRGAWRVTRTGEDSISSSPSIVEVFDKAGEAGEAGRDREGEAP